MDSLVLLVVVAAVVLPIVLLLGFAGCGFSVGALVSQPTILSATPLSATSLVPERVAIKLRNTYDSVVTFEAIRKKGSEPYSDPFIAVVVPVMGEPDHFLFVDETVEPATQYAVLS